MNQSNLKLHSEKYAATGNLAADGYKKLLGTPTIELLGTLIREAIQNSCDAAKNGNGPEIHFRLRRLDEIQLQSLRKRVFSELPISAQSEQSLKTFLNLDDPWVLEIADFNTTGLGGPTRADKIPLGNKSTDFIDFMRNVGSRRDTVNGGGTYGYGKTSLYISSACSTIIVDSQTHFMDVEVRRLMACHLGEAHQAQDSEEHIHRYTGRHWWGVEQSGEGFVEPLLGDAATELASDLGMPLRGKFKEGTTIMILDPIFTTETEPENLIGLISESILWNFWPRLMKDADKSKKIQLTLELDGKHYPIPIPEEFPPLDIFCDAMRSLRSEEINVEEISSQRPRKLLGKLAIRKGLRLERTSLVSDDLSNIPKVSSHIAVMRPIELVVRYFEGPPLPDNLVEWAGVFVTDTDDDVEQAFAKSEPPAHDDWQPRILPSGNARTYVSVALRKIGEKAQSVANPITLPVGQTSSGPSLAKVANKLGQFLDRVSNDADKQRRPGQKSSNAGSISKLVKQPVFSRLEQIDGLTHAVFTVNVNALNASCIIKAQPMMVMEGGASISEGFGDLSPRLRAWKCNDEVIGEEQTIEVENFEGELEIYVSLQGDYAVTVSTSLIKMTRGA